MDTVCALAFNLFVELVYQFVCYHWVSTCWHEVACLKTCGMPRHWSNKNKQIASATLTQTGCRSGAIGFLYQICPHSARKIWSSEWHLQFAALCSRAGHAYITWPSCFSPVQKWSAIFSGYEHKNRLGEVHLQKSLSTCTVLHLLHTLNTNTCSWHFANRVRERGRETKRESRDSEKRWVFSRCLKPSRCLWIWDTYPLS